MTWSPDWVLEPVPCEHPDTCGPTQPICVPCVAGLRAFIADGHPPHKWAELKEWHRESWRREALDTNGGDYHANPE